MKVVNKWFPSIKVMQTLTKIKQGFLRFGSVFLIVETTPAKQCRPLAHEQDFSCLKVMEYIGSDISHLTSD